VTVELTVEGSGARRGEMHGEGLRDLVVEAADRWCTSAGNRAEELLATLVDESGFRETARHFASELVDEVEGIARGSGVDARTVWALNLFDEDWWIRDGLTMEHCSSFGAVQSDGVIVAQNMDLPAWLHGLQVLLNVRPDDRPRALIPTYAGMIGTNALNELGIGVCVNTISSLPTDRRGLPVAFVIRLLAETGTIEEATTLLRRLPHASGQNYLVGSPTGLADFECGANSIQQVGAGAQVLAHTNHSVCDVAQTNALTFTANSLQRLEALEERLSQGHLSGPERAKAILGTPPLCRGGEGDAGFTFYSVVMELGATQTLHLTSGPPDTYPYRRFGIPT
jgi:isopenicillin-N N-acyltransferase like protein